MSVGKGISIAAIWIGYGIAVWSSTTINSAGVTVFIGVLGIIGSTISTCVVAIHSK